MAGAVRLSPSPRLPTCSTPRRRPACCSPAPGSRPGSPGGATDSQAGDLAATALTALSCVTLARLLVAVAPLTIVKVALVVMAVIDAYLVFGRGIQTSAALLNAAAPAFELPRLQTAFLRGASLGSGDLFVATVFVGGTSGR